MNRNHKALLSALLAGTVLLFGIAGWAQQPKPKQKPVPQPAAEQEEPYTEEEYDAYEKATKEADLDKRGPALIAFIDKYPKSKLMTYIITGYQTLMYELEKGQQYAKLLPVAETWLKYHPEDFTTIAYITEAAQMTGQDKKFIEYGQKIYAQKPTGQLAAYLAQSFEKVGDQAHYLEWTEKLFAYPEFKDNYNIRMLFVKKYADEKNYKKAASYAQEALKALEFAKKPEAKPEAEWRKEMVLNRRSANMIIGINFYDGQKYADAIQYMESALKVEDFDTAYYYIGLSQWKLNKIEGAINSFAKAILLKGESEAQAKEHLEKLYKSMHNDTLIGIEKVYKRNKEELATKKAEAK